MPSKSHSETSNGHISQDSQRSDAKEVHDDMDSNREKKTAKESSPSRGKHKKSPALHNSNDQRQSSGEKQPHKPVPEENQDNESYKYGDKNQLCTEQAKVKVKVGQRSNEKRETESVPKISSERKKHKSPIQNAPKCMEFADKSSLPSDLSSNKDQLPSNCNLPSATLVPQGQENDENEANISQLAKEVSRTTYHKSAEVRNGNEPNTGKLATGMKDVNRTTHFQPANNDKQVTRTNINKSSGQIGEEIYSNVNKPAGKVKEENGGSTRKATAKESRTKPGKPVLQTKANILKDQVLSTAGVGGLPSPIRESTVNWPLVVKIDLSLLSRIPSPSSKEGKLPKNCATEHTSQKNKEGLKESKGSKTKRKHGVRFSILHISSFH